ncbi:TPA: anthranilate 1,2-dioxygenase electron transfer component AntC [Pseudomonas putida]|uniref:anthranilate 1,2-dioxygenase electron transfer component AntC n=1 Tax=Pseudomonas putida TaxID=303 RepID=UPI00110CA931|nr:anthranilate 1,2-dioxygenase electron transfer component AntC [Pseudomonas putida]MDD1992745.1 anthranilate 1,2-dioxygenase electron transfer component AntC [Pseudomonas putida]HDS0918413.1 anthranilate 1,2-dioxygenase electron transfer component AntC [Pseudomonas putida]HDS0931694.1 anthranilate 1,2-dioxygenase electron transfer component AntC [Pseudomonas putida]HDS1782322.1 anthranilate 1,2-dioxygenase electron transfer component AntC [Pseudomonas putida]HDS3796971.1 anthranilate 1,2-dio
MYKVALNFSDGKTLFCAVRPNDILLDAALKSGIKIPLDCREGVCATCQGRCESGMYTQDYVDEEALSSQDLADRKILSCQTRVLSDASFYFDFDSTLCGGEGAADVTTTVTQVIHVSDSTAIIKVEIDSDQPVLNYLPGQYARLKVPGTEHSRSYSFACAPGSRNLEFLVRLLPSGVMTDYVRERCKVGDTIKMEAPLGAFYLRHIDRPVIMVAGGTGLSAFLGMLDQLAEKGGSGFPVHLFYGVRTEQDLCELTRIETYRARIQGFEFTPVLSDPGDSWEGRKGFIPAHLGQYERTDTPFDMYMCGPPPMVESIKAWHADKARTAVRMYFEKFTESNT